MLPVEPAVLTDHLRLKPNAEFQSEGINLIHQFLQGTAEFLLIDIPVPQRARIVGTAAKPAIVHDEHVHSQILCRLCQLAKGFSRKIKIGGFPAVQKNRPDLVCVPSAADMVPDAAVQVAGKLPEARRGITHNDFRRRKLIPRLQRIGKLLIRKPNGDPGLIVLVLFRQCLKASAVNKLHRPAAAGCFTGFRGGQNQERIILMGGNSAGASDRIDPVADRLALSVSLHGMTAVERQYIVLSLRKVQGRRQYLLNDNSFLPCIFKDNTAGDDIQLRQNPIAKFRLQTQPVILQCNKKRLHPFIARCTVFTFMNIGKIVQYIFFIPDFISTVSEIAPVNPAAVPHNQ